MKYFVLVVIAFLVIIFVEQPGHISTFDQALTQRVAQAAYAMPVQYTSNKNQAGQSRFLNDNSTISESQINTYLKKNSLRTQVNDRPKLWSSRDGKATTISAMGLDWTHHIANSYLVGIHPFSVENDWLPLYTLAQRKNYQLDKAQYRAVDLWQNSAQAFVITRGDCEDHAIVLADWLISEGLDARVVLGKYKTEGHAWVVVRKNEQFYLLEATDKRRQKSWQHYPLAKLTQHYFPQFMFNRTDFWQNNTGKLTTDYQGQHWQKVSQFTKFKKS